MTSIDPIIESHIISWERPSAKKVLTSLDDRSTIDSSTNKEPLEMTREDTKAKILEVGAQIVHEKGFNNTGIQEILSAAGVPKGSFYFYFKSKDEFGLELVDYFVSLMGGWMDRHLADPRPSPVKALKNFFDELMAYFLEKGCKAGCPVGNIAQEMADLNEAFRARAEQAFTQMKQRIKGCLEAARECGEIDSVMDPDETADFILNSWEGALLRMKAQGDIRPLKIFDKMIFGGLLKR